MHFLWCFQRFQWNSIIWNLWKLCEMLLSAAHRVISVKKWWGVSECCVCTVHVLRLTRITLQQGRTAYCRRNRCFFLCRFNVCWILRINIKQRIYPLVKIWPTWYLYVCGKPLKIVNKKPKWIGYKWVKRRHPVYTKNQTLIKCLQIQYLIKTLLKIHKHVVIKALKVQTCSSCVQNNPKLAGSRKILMLKFGSPGKNGLKTPALRFIIYYLLYC